MTKILSEFVFATYVKSNEDYDKDALFVKEHQHHPDGTITPHLRMVENYQREFYVTKPDYRDHDQKKEYEVMDKLDHYVTNQATMGKRLYSILHGRRPHGYVNVRDLTNSPFVYGTDVSTPTLIAHDYKVANPDLVSPATLAVLDLETDVLNGTGDIISGSLTFKDKGLLVVTQDFLGDEILYGGDYKTAILNNVKLHIGEYVNDRNMSIEVMVVKDSTRIVIELLRRTHAWKPDILGIWNITFDMPKMLNALEQGNINPAAVFSDPDIPNEYKSFNYNEASRKKVTSAGKESIIHIADLWHTVTTPASFYCIDLMCLFKRVRGREQNRNSYSLDAILGDMLDIGKLRFKATDNLSGIDWHRKMQSEYKLEYLTYNLFDCISVELLDELTEDVASALFGSLGWSEISKIASNPRRLVDDLYFDLKAEDKIIGTCGDSLVDEYDKMLPSLKGWIIALPSELVVPEMGAKVINRSPKLKTNIYLHAADMDLIGAYPNGGCLLNVGKATRKMECCGIQGLTEHQWRAWGINLSSVNSNSVSLAQVGYGFPDLDDLLADFIDTI